VEKKKAMEQELQELQEKLEAAQYVGRLHQRHECVPSLGSRRRGPSLGRGARPNHRKQRSVEEPFAKDLQKELTGLATTVANLHTEQEALQSEFQTVKQISAELATKIVRALALPACARLARAAR